MSNMNFRPLLFLAVFMGIGTQFDLDRKVFSDKPLNTVHGEFPIELGRIMTTGSKLLSVPAIEPTPPIARRQTDIRHAPLTAVASTSGERVEDTAARDDEKNNQKEQAKHIEKQRRDLIISFEELQILLPTTFQGVKALDGCPAVLTKLTDTTSGERASDAFYVSGLRIHESYGPSLGKNHRPSYRALASAATQPGKSYLAKEVGSLLASSWFMKPGLYLLNNAVVTASGYFGRIDCLHSGYCAGGCSLSTCSLPSKNIHESLPGQHLGTVISVAGRWTDNNIWHFALEALVGLASVPDYQRLLDLESGARVHISKKSNFALSMLAIVGVNSSKVIDGTAKAARLIRPRMGDCGKPGRFQALWLRDKLRRHAHDRLAKLFNDSYATKLMHTPDTLVLMERTRSRRVKNSEAVRAAASQIASLEGLRLYVHNDRALPSFDEQLSAFARAAVVIGPHGAGETFLVAAGAGTRVIEFVHDGSPNLCYFSLSGLIGFNHTVIGYSESQGVKVPLILEAMSAKT